MDRKNLMGLTIEEMKAFVAELGEKPFRGKQLFKWVSRGVTDFDEMTDFSKELRAKLKRAARIGSLKVLKVQQDRRDGTRKLLLGLEDGNAIESVFMKTATAILSAYPRRWAARWAAGSAPLPWTDSPGI